MELLILFVDVRVVTTLPERSIVLEIVGVDDCVFVDARDCVGRELAVVVLETLVDEVVVTEDVEVLVEEVETVPTDPVAVLEPEGEPVGDTESFGSRDTVSDPVPLMQNLEDTEGHEVDDSERLRGGVPETDEV